MKKIIVMFIALMFVVGLCGTLFAQDRLETIKKRGVLIAGVKDSTPGFGFVDEKTREIVGYDVDFVRAIANKLGVKLGTQSRLHPQAACPSSLKEISISSPQR